MLRDQHAEDPHRIKGEPAPRVRVSQTDRIEPSQVSQPSRVGTVARITLAAGHHPDGARPSGPDQLPGSPHAGYRPRLKGGPAPVFPRLGAGSPNSTAPETVLASRGWPVLRWPHAYQGLSCLRTCRLTARNCAMQFGRD